MAGLPHHHRYTLHQPTEGTGPEVWPLVIEDVRGLVGFHLWAWWQDGPNPALEALIADMRARNALEWKRYGTPLRVHNGRDPLTDAYQELLDAAAYLCQYMEQPQVDGELRNLYRWTLADAYTLRRLLMERAGR